MESSSIELKLISGEDLRAFNFFQKLSLFTVASIASDDPTKKVENNQQQRTPTDRDGDLNPEWNHQMKFLLGADSDSDHLFLHLDLRHEGVLFGIGDRTIGEVRIPLNDLMDESSISGVVRYVRYQVRTSDGKPNGVLNLSYTFNSKSGKAPNPSKIQYPTVEEVPNLDLQDQSLSFCRESYWSSFPIPERQGFDCWSSSSPSPRPPPPPTVSYPRLHLPPAAAGPGFGHHYHGGAMWPRGSVMRDWNGW